MRINHNIAALNAYRNLEINNGNTSKSLEKLSSGLRINRAADDAAGLAISEKMRSQIRGLDMAQRNALDGISVVQTADGALSTTQEILQRMRELSVQAANGSNTDSDRSNIQEEINQLTSEVNRIGNTTEFNTKNLLNGFLSISGGQLIKTGSTTGTLGSAVTLDPNSVLPNGLYSVDITNVSGSTYQMSLKQDTDNDGVYETTVVNNPSFNLGDNVSLPGTGVEVQTLSGTTITDNATFEIENGIIDNSAKMQIGANAGQTVSLEINDMRSKALLISSDVSGGGAQTVTLLDGSTQKVWYTTTAGANDGSSANIAESALDVTSTDKAQAAISIYDDAVQRISSERARLGAVQNRLEYTVDNLKTMSENVTSSESRIRDVDMALEMTNFTKDNILNQAAQAMLSQANQMPQGVLQLLK